ncbi:MAG: flagellar biosynthetic protein FliO [Oscillospiraceae bacterium]|nr:flagellar biosynthetic protein FliO [Oscillospiraceae bacterium]
MRHVWLILGGASPSPTPQPLESGGNLWPLLGGILGFVAIMALSWLGLRYLSKRNLFGARGRYVQVLDRVATGRDSMILLLRVADKVLITGVSKEGFRTLGEVDPEALAAEGAKQADARAPGSARDATATAATATSATSATAAAPNGRRGFWGRFAHNMGVFSGVLPKGTPPARPETALQDEAAAPSFGEALQKAEEAQAAEMPQAVQAAQQAMPPGEDQPAPPQPTHPQPTSQQQSAPPQPATQQPPAPPQPAPLPDYNEAIRRMKQYSRMESRAVRREPTASENLAFVRAARVYSEKENQDTGEEEIDSLAGRISRRTQRLSRRFEGEGGSGLL